MSPRLRAKLESTEVDEFDIPKSGAPIGLIVGGLVVLGLVVGGIVWMRGRSSAEKTAAAQDTTATAPVAAADSMADSLAADTTHTAATPPPVTTPPKPATPPPTASTAGSGGSSGGTTVTKTGDVPSGTKYGVLVGTYLSEDRAKEELEKLKASTQLEGRVTTVTEAGEPAYRVVLGSFPSHAAAERKAAELSGSGSVREARVVPIGRD